MESAAQTWLARQCEMIPGAASGVVVLGTARLGSPTQAAGWPAGAAGTRELLTAARTAASERRVVINGRSGSPEGVAVEHRHIAVPFTPASGITGAVAVEIGPGGPRESRTVVDQLRRGASWLSVLESGGVTQDRLVTAIELIGTCLAHERFEAAATAAATELAVRFRCERVSIGFAHRGRMRVEALSHSARFDRRSQLVRDLEAAMDEASDQDATVAHPAPPGFPTRIKRAHEELAERPRAGSVWSVPIVSGERIVGAITFERPRGEAADAEGLLLCERVASLAGPVLAVMRAADARILDRAREFVRLKISHLLGPDHTTLKAAAVAFVALLLLLTFAKGDYRIQATATLEGRVQRAIVAGLDGYISEANVRAGDLVKKGQILGRLDERDLVLEQRKWAANREQLRKEQREALAGHERTRVAILRARLDQADAQLALLSKQLARTRLVAPFDGIVVKGDLSQSLGSPVAKGDVLFELAPLEGYRIILKVDDRDVSHVSEGESGELALSALPGEPLALTVERVVPVATAEKGRNYFRVEARLDEPVASLRPGMEGVAKIQVDRRRLAWIWTHELVDWLRLWLWSWWA